MLVDLAFSLQEPRWNEVGGTFERRILRRAPPDRFEMTGEPYERRFFIAVIRPFGVRQSTKREVRAAYAKAMTDWIGPQAPPLECLVRAVDPDGTLAVDMGYTRSEGDATSRVAFTVSLTEGLIRSGLLKIDEKEFPQLGTWEQREYRRSQASAIANGMGMWAPPQKTKHFHPVRPPK
jgi:hypothetical protein